MAARTEANRKKIRFMALITIFAAIEVIFCFTPLGSLPLGGGIVATLSHLPVIVAAVLLGTKAGAVLGGVFGVCSLIWWSTIGVASPSAFAFTPLGAHGNFFSLLICIVPRILLGVIAALLYRLLDDKIGNIPAAVVSAVLSTVCHSVMVLGSIYLCFSGNAELSALIGGNFVAMVVVWAGINAVMEIIAAGLVSGALIKPLLKVYKK